MGKEKDNEMIPKARLDDEIKKREQLEEQFKMLQQQMNVMQANAPKPEAPKPADLFEGLFEEGETVPDIDQFKEAIRRLEAKYSGVISNLSTMLQFPDYRNIVETYLPQAIKSNPALEQLIRNAGPNTMQIAYALGQYEKKLSEKAGGAAPAETPGSQAAIQAALKAAEQPGSASSAQSKAAMDFVQRVSDMSDDQLVEHAEDVKAQETE